MNMEGNNGKIKLERRITILEMDSKYTMESLKHIRKQVSNELPHQIEMIDKKVDSLIDAFSKFQIKNQKWIIGILISVILMLFATIINFVK